MKDFQNHPNLSDEINGNIAQSEIEGGVFVTELQPGTLLKIRTRNTTYKMLIIDPAAGTTMFWGNPVHCPTPVHFQLHGSTWGGSMLKIAFIGRGMRIEGSRENQKPGTVYLTTAVESIEEVQI